MSHDTGGAASPVDRRIEEIIAAGQLAGVFRADTTPAVINALMLAAIVAGLRQLPERDVSTVTDEVVDLLIHGTGPP